jgi:hypothetical protein
MKFSFAHWLRNRALVNPVADSPTQGCKITLLARCPNLDHIQSRGDLRAAIKELGDFPACDQTWNLTKLPKLVDWVWGMYTAAERRAKRV